MNYDELGYRGFYQNILEVSLNDELREALKDFDGIEEATHVVGFGINHHYKGLMLEVLSLCKKEDYFVEYYEQNENISVKIPVALIKNQDFNNYSYFELDFIEELAVYEDKISEIMVTPANDCGVTLSRAYEDFDDYRYPTNMDIVKVKLLLDDMKEYVWVLIEAFDDGIFEGTILIEPKKNFGCHKDDTIQFAFIEYEDKSCEFVCNVLLIVN